MLGYATSTGVNYIVGVRTTSEGAEEVPTETLAGGYRVISTEELYYVVFDAHLIGVVPDSDKNRPV